MVFRKTKKRLYMAAGFVCLALGVIGVFLPVMPTAPFLILAAYCFSRGSKRWHHWLLHHPIVGHPIRDWEHHGVIRLRAKVMATALISISMVTTGFFVPIAPVVKLGIGVVLACAVLFIWSRPSVPRQTQSPDAGEAADQSLDDSAKTQ